MIYYTIRPIAQFLENNSKAEISRKELARLATSIAQTASSKKINKAAAVHYSAIMDKIKKAGTGAQKNISPAQIKIIVHDYIRQHQLHYLTEEHRPAHKNIFKLAGPGQRKSYDIAFYHPESQPDTPFHHSIEYSGIAPGGEEKLLAQITAALKKPELASRAKIEQAASLIENNTITGRTLRSQFYLRCEELGEILLIGNMQIDARDKNEKWTNEQLQEVIGSNGNMYRIMVQTAIQEGLKRGLTRFIFQGGYANEITQWARKEEFQAREIITTKNIKRYQEQYKTLEAQYHEIAPGDIIALKNPYGDKRSSVVITKTAKALKCMDYEAGFLIPGIYSLSYQKGFRAGLNMKTIQEDFIKTISIEKKIKESLREFSMHYFASEENDYYSSIDSGHIKYATIRAKYWKSRPENERLLHCSHKEFYRDLAISFAGQNASAVLHAINKIFDYVIKIDFSEQKTQKIKYLTELLEATGGKCADVTSSETKTVYELIQPFLVHFGYHKLVLENFPNLKQIINEHGGVTLYDPRQNYWSIKQTRAPRPELNKLETLVFTDRSKNKKSYPVLGDSHLHNWYEETLPAVIKKLNLTIKPTLITTDKMGGNYGTAYGWEIITPRAELQARGIICF